mmetsp:Transcript_13827/g.34776  ORF Transcript_13827/g.34776 Transcript_13827/m.34776 type:complete len:195 (+) Transcript_13827:826-1410(+)
MFRATTAATIAPADEPASGVPSVMTPRRLNESAAPSKYGKARPPGENVTPMLAAAALSVAKPTASPSLAAEVSAAPAARRDDDDGDATAAVADADDTSDDGDVAPTQPRALCPRPARRRGPRAAARAASAVAMAAEPEHLEWSAAAGTALAAAAEAPGPPDSPKWVQPREGGVAATKAGAAMPPTRGHEKTGEA